MSHEPKVIYVTQAEADAMMEQNKALYRVPEHLLAGLRADADRSRWTEYRVKS